MIPRIRTVKPEFFAHEDLYDAEIETGLPLRVAFVGLWCCSDREGRFEWRPRVLKIHILPHDDLDFSRVLHALTTRGFVRKYASNGRYFGWIPKFRRHQVINNRERESELPNPEECQDVSDACDTRESRDGHAWSESESGREGKGTINTPPKKTVLPKNSRAYGTNPRAERRNPRSQKPPTLEEVEAYCRERDNQVNPRAWMDHYESNGWMVGKTRMKDWRAAVRTWEHNQRGNGNERKDPFERLREQEAAAARGEGYAAQCAKRGAVGPGDGSFVDGDE